MLEKIQAPYYNLLHLQLSSITSHGWITLHPIHRFQEVKAPMNIGTTRYAYNKGIKEDGTTFMKYSLFHEAMHLPHNLTFPTNTHKIAHSIPRIVKKKNPLFIPVRLAPVPGLPMATLVFRVFSLNLLKLDMRSKARLTFSEADAGVVGIDSTKDHKLEVNQLAEPLAPSFAL